MTGMMVIIIKAQKPNRPSSGKERFSVAVPGTAFRVPGGSFRDDVRGRLRLRIPCGRQQMKFGFLNFYILDLCRHSRSLLSGNPEKTGCPITVLGHDEKKVVIASDLRERGNLAFA